MFETRGVWWLFSLPVLLNIGVFAGVIASLWVWVLPLARAWMESTDMYMIFFWIVVVAAALILLIAYAFVFSIIAEIIGSPFYEEIGTRIDKAKGAAIVERPWYKELWFAISQESRKLVLLVVILLVSFLLQFIPVVGQVLSAVIGFIVLVVTLGADSVGPPLARRGLMLSDRRRWTIKHILPVMGLGLAKALFLVVPVLNIIVLPIAAAGGTLLVQEYDK